MFKGFTLKDWVIGYFTLGIWILYKMHKNGVPIVKVLGGYVGVIVLIGVLGGIFGDKDKNKSSNTETKTETVVAEKKIDNSEAKEQSDKLSYKDFKIGMDRKDIPSTMKLVKGSKMNDYDDSYQYKDENKVLVEIDTYKATVDFVISEVTNKVTTVTYNINDVKNLSLSEFENVFKLFTNKEFKYREVDGYSTTNPSKNKGANKILEASYMEGPIEYTYNFIYSNENGLNPNSIQLNIFSANKQKSDEETNAIVNKSVDDMYVTVKRGAFLCSNTNSYKRLFDYADEKPNSYLPSDCFQTQSGKFIKTATKDYYNGRTILQIMGGGNKFYWVLEDYIE